MLNQSTTYNQSIRDIEFYTSSMEIYKAWYQRMVIIADIIFTILLMMGCIGNLITIGAILYRNLHKKVTYTAIAALAVADIAAVIFRFLFVQWKQNNYPYISVTLFLQILDGLGFVSMISSNLHVVILFRTRCYLFVQPLEGLVMTPVSILKQSGCAWIFSLVLVSIYIGFNRSHRVYSVRISEVFIIYMFLWLTLLVPVLFYHCKKTRILRRGSTLRTHVVSKMNKVVMAILIIQAITRCLAPVPRLMLFFTFNKHIILYEFFSILEGWEMLNHAVNPVIYFFSDILCGRKTYLKCCLESESRNV